MKNFKSSFGITELIYEQHLGIIKNINFTLREVDIISCILHNRGEKKIASIFLISPRTISTHVYNIMNKIGCNNKDQIIDFIETSGKLSFIKEYYIHLLIKSYFEKLLSKIGTTINKKTLHCFCAKDEIFDTDKKTYQAVEKHLKLANIEITTEKSIDKVCDLKKISTENYYENMISIVSYLIRSEEVKKLDDLNKLIDEFKDLCQQIPEGNNENTFRNFIKRKINKPLVRFIVSFLGILLLVCIYQFFTYKNDKIIIDKKPEVIFELENLLNSIKKEQFTANNLNKEQRQNNQSIIKKAEQILAYRNIPEVQKYFEETNMDSKFLLDYVYNLHSIASYYMYNLHGKKSRDILLYSRDLIINYLNKRSGVEIDFDNISAEELYAELDVIKDLPELFARITYAIGRTYIYQGDLNDAIKHFEISKSLGCRLNLFECHISNVSGILLIKKINLEDNLFKQSKEISRKEIKMIIEGFDSFKDNNQSYILDFIPNTLNQKTINPSKDPYNVFTNQNRVIQCYTDLMFISDDNTEIENLVKKLAFIFYNGFEIKDEITGDKKGIKNILDIVPHRSFAALYKILGDAFLFLYKKNIDGTELLKPLFEFGIINSESINFSKNLNLESAFKLFDKARLISRNTDFTKADAYDGLIRVYEQKLNESSPHEKEEILKKIQDISDKKNEINSKLGR